LVPSPITNQVLVGIVNGDVIGEGTKMGEPGLKLEVAHLLIPGATLRTPSAAADERDRNPIADSPLGNRPANRFHDTGKLMARDVRQYDVWVVPLPAMPVAQANTARHHLEDHAVAARHRVLNVLNLRCLAKRPVNDGLHSIIPLQPVGQIILFDQGTSGEMFIVLKFRILAATSAPFTEPLSR
jgi:hypothetical protein